MIRLGVTEFLRQLVKGFDFAMGMNCFFTLLPTVLTSILGTAHNQPPFLLIVWSTANAIMHLIREQA